MTLSVELNCSWHGIARIVGELWERVASHSEKGGPGFFVSLDLGDDSGRGAQTHKQPESGGVYNQKGSEGQRSVNSDQTR